MKLTRQLSHRFYLWTLGVIFLASFLFFNFDYRYIDDYRLFLHNDTFQGFLESYKWGFSRIVGNYFFGLLYLPQNNIFLNVSVLVCHFLNGWLISKILLSKGSKTIAYLCGLLFISLPMTSEAFFWGIAGQVVFAMFFFLLGVNYYLSHQEKINLRNGILLTALFALSISFYEVFLLFSFLFLLLCLWRRKNVLFGFILSLVSACYLAGMKLYVLLAGGTFTTQLKTTPITISAIPHRVLQIFKDVINVFVGKVSLEIYKGSFHDFFHGSIPWQLWIVLGLFLVVAFVDIWFFYIPQKTTKKSDRVIFSIAVLVGLSLSALLTIPANYFHDLRTFYPFTLCLVLGIAEHLRLTSRNPQILKLHLSAIVVLIALNILVLRVENSHYSSLYQIDWPFIQTLEKNYTQGKTTIVFLPGYNSTQPLETQMNLAYYPESNFIYGTHLLSVISIRFTRTPYIILGSHNQIQSYVSKNKGDYLVYDFAKRQMMPVTEFLSPIDTSQIDLTSLSEDRYLFRDMDENIRKIEGAVIFDRKLYKTFVTHPNCSDKPATLTVTVPLTNSRCQLTFRLLNIQDTEGRTTSDGTQVQVIINGNEVDSMTLKPVDPEQSKKLYHYAVPGLANQTAEIKFVVTDGGRKNCNDDKIFIAEPLLNCR